MDHNSHIAGATHNKAPEQRPCPIVSSTYRDGVILEMLYASETQSTSFAVWKNEQWEVMADYTDSAGKHFDPYSPNNNLVKNGVILFPSGPEEYGTDAELLHDIQGYIHRYVDVEPRFEQIASYYVLLSWIYDAFRELPYLRLRGDFGSGKTRFLLTVGALCYKPIFSSGASTVSPLFHILDRFGGTLIIDEGDFRWSDEKADIVKILNNGNVKGIPVLRNEQSPTTKEFNPRAFQVYGPKIVATRGYYQDQALESRFITEDMGGRPLRGDIPINLSDTYQGEALHLRNKLLLFRFRNLHKKAPLETLVDRRIEPRLNQVFVPLLSIIEDAETRDALRTLARTYHSEIAAERGMGVEAQVLEIIRDVSQSAETKQPAIKTITRRFMERFGDDYMHGITTKWMGGLVRRQLHLRTQKSNGVFVIPTSEQPKLKRLYERYGIA